MWKNSLSEDQKKEAIGFFNVIKWHSEIFLDKAESLDVVVGTNYAHDLYIVPYSKEYKSLLGKAADLLQKAGDLASSPTSGSLFIFLFF